MRTSISTEGAVLSAFSAGARSLVLKEPSERDGVLPEATRWVHRGGTYIDPRIADRFVTMLLRHSRAKGPFGLTVRERRVLGQLAYGLTNREIAANLNISINTVKSHLHHAMRKLDVRDRHEAARISEREGFV